LENIYQNTAFILLTVLLKKGRLLRAYVRVQIVIHLCNTHTNVRK